MSLNQPYSYDKNKTKNNGNYFNTIDFKINQNLTNESITSKTQPPLGTLTIGKFDFNMTAKELQLLAETCDLAIQTSYKKFKLGLL